MKRNAVEAFITFPAYSICLLSFVRTGSFTWLYCIIALWLLYELVWWTSSHILTIFQISDFYNEFLGEKRNFDIEPIKESEFDISFLKDFGYCVYNYSKQPKWKFKNSVIDLVNTPVLVFHAIPLNNKVMSSSKAYLYGLGMFAIVCRTKEVNKNPFEKFLFHHELQHINDFGLLNYRSVARHIMRLVLHALIFITFISNIWAFAAYAIFLGISAINLWLAPLVNREFIADLLAILKFEKLEDRVFILRLLIRVLSSQFSTSGFLMKNISLGRMHSLDKVKGILSRRMAESEITLLKLVGKPFYSIEDLDTKCVTILIIIVFSFFVNSNPIAFLKAIVGCFPLCLFSYVLSLFLSTRMYISVCKKMAKKFVKEDFYQPFKIEKNTRIYTADELAAMKFS